jgi:hypothetical protein
VVGHNPYPLYSFIELRKGMGPNWGVCEACRRYIQLWRALDDRDTRTTTFSCSVCGDAGRIATEDPAKEGFQADPRARPLRHPMAALRLKHLHRLADPFGHKKAAREALPQQEKPRHDPPPRFKLVPLPFRTLRQALDFGLTPSIHCPSCHDWRPIEFGAEHLDRPFAGTRFVCRCVKRALYGEAMVVCGATGQLLLRPAGDDPDRTVVDIQCGGGGRGRQQHPRWEIAGVDLDRAPWAGLMGRRERFRCPGCGGMPRHTFHIPYPHRPSAATETGPEFT